MAPRSRSRGRGCDGVSEREISGVELCQRLRNKIDRYPCGCQTRWDEALWRSVDVMRCVYHQRVLDDLSAVTG